MTNDQLVPAFMAALLGEGVTPAQIEDAVSRVRSLPLGQRLSRLAERDDDERTDSMVRAFVFEQSKLLERATK